MAHVLEVWQEHAEPYLERIVETVDQAGNSIVKCRAGHILEERLGITDTRIEDWKAFRQRGGSRKLDPYKAFAPTYSENWMISLNA